MNRQIKKYTNQIKSKADILKTDYKVKSLGIFGSLVRNEYTEKSDIDILVEFNESVGFFLYSDLKYFLNEILSHRVDLITKKALDRNQNRCPGMKEQVTREVIPVL